MVDVVIVSSVSRCSVAVRDPGSAVHSHPLQVMLAEPESVRHGFVAVETLASHSHAARRVQDSVDCLMLNREPRVLLAVGVEPLCRQRSFR